jgi:ribosomal protein S21
MAKKPVNVSVSAKECKKNHERMIKRFIKKTKKARIIEKVRNRRYYKKPSILKREKIAKAQRLRHKEQQKALRAEERRNRKKR